MHKTVRYLSGSALLLAMSLHAQPAPWYRWTSQLDGRVVCLQTSPGPGWERSSGPYDNPACLRRR